ncbi:hypothetical protein H5410_022421 [Solanum commersonii]|uniref:Uncharacterized protein n=1 Tax=Solanum commersonii TaxID=4109 RepID=A0A9J5ZHY4_SOLCO|nr:hypothetical protein H5410_022421 [Solanum commersonii]
MAIPTNGQPTPKAGQSTILASMLDFPPLPETSVLNPNRKKDPIMQVVPSNLSRKENEDNAPLSPNYVNFSKK